MEEKSAPKDAAADAYRCEGCNRSCASARGLKLHLRACIQPHHNGTKSAQAPAEKPGRDSSDEESAEVSRITRGRKSKAATQQGPARTLLSCERCGLPFDPKKDGPHCKNCTRDNLESEGIDEDLEDAPKKDDSGEDSGPCTLQEVMAPNETQDGEDGPIKNIGAVEDIIKAVATEGRKTKASGKADLTCPVCSKTFSKKHYLQRHLQLTACSGGPPPAHPCEVCGKVYTRKDNLREHLRAHAGEVTRRKKFKCEHCGKCFHGLSLLKIHLRVHTGEKPFPCDYCSKAFPSVTSLNKHRRIHTGEKPYACAECGMRFSLKGTLNRHCRIHTGIRPHKCPYCGKQFIQGGGLKAHLFHHTGMNGFKCTVCDKVFNRKARLDLHMKYLHLKEKSHVCADCGKGFTRREDLTRHSVLHTGEKPFQCPTCLKRFSIKPSLKIHMVTHTKEEPRSCHECGRAFIRKDCLMRHMRKRHRDLLDRILLDEEDEQFSQPKSSQVPVARVLSEQALCESIRELLGLLVDEPTLKGFGYPDRPVDELLEAVIRRCGHSPASPDDYGYMDRLRENSKLLFTVVIDDNAVKTLLNNQTVDEVILHVLRLAKT
ncbi:zinc finger protein 260-like [Ornithodoros turicata]